jgi:hypothetical protein
MAQSFFVTDITIGRGTHGQTEDIGNVISCDNMGNMVFRDRYINGGIGVTLTQLLNGGGGSGGTGDSKTKEVQVGDWQFDRNDPIYNRDFWYVDIYYALIGFPVENLDPKKVRATAKLIISPTVTEEIEFDDILVYNDHIKVISSSKIHCYVNIEIT